MFSRLPMAAAIVVLSVCAASPARADGFITPFFGANFAGATDLSLPNAAEENSMFNYGVSAGWMGAGIIGVEGDLSYSPKFVAPGIIAGQTNVVTAMANFIVGVPLGGQKGGGVRPYGVAGVGLLRTNVDLPADLADASPDRNGFGFDVGGGLNAYFTDHVGLRGDLRYFRDFQARAADSAFGVVFGRQSVDFWRGSVGVIFRF